MNGFGSISRRSALYGTAGMLAGCATPIWKSPERAEPKWQIGCYTRPWDQHDYRVALDAIAEAGFKYAGLMTTKSKSRLVISTSTTAEEAEQVAQELQQRGLRVPSVYGGGIPVGNSVREGIAGLKNLIDCCAVVESQTLLMGGVTKPELYEPYYKAIAECCGYAADKGIGITLKPHGGSNATGKECREAVARVGHSNFTLWYDPGNILYYSDGKLDPAVEARAVDGLVTGMCVKDYLDPKNVMVTPGTGRVDFPGVMRSLRRGGFRGGPLVIETLAPGDPKQTIAEAIQARRFLEALLA